MVSHFLKFVTAFVNGNLWKVLYQANWNQPGKELADHYINLTRKFQKYVTPLVSMNPGEAFSNHKDLDLGINHNSKNSYDESRVYIWSILRRTSAGWYESRLRLILTISLRMNKASLRCHVRARMMASEVINFCFCFKYFDYAHFVIKTVFRASHGYSLK